MARWAWLACAAWLASCRGDAPHALGTLEYDRITVPSPVPEPIVRIAVREGQRVERGQLLLELEPERRSAVAQAARADAERQGEVLAEVRAGPRAELLQQARARLDAAHANAREAERTYARARSLGETGTLAPIEVDRARAAAEMATAEVERARAALDELEHGSRVERLAQARAAAAAASARASAEEALLAKLRVVAPRDAVVDSLPYPLGDQAPIGAPLAVLLVGDAPYARVYVPEPIRVDVRVGQRAFVEVDGLDAPLRGRVRMIRHEPSFTPYYALTGEDAARLSYLAEIQLDDPRARDLPAGLPVRARFALDEAHG